MKKVFGSFKFWLTATLVVAGLAFVQQPQNVGIKQRIQHLEQLVKCPSCEDLSVYNSNATSAIAVRTFIASEVAKGSSDTKILTSLEARYGTSILLSPSTSGLGVLLWLSPVLVAMLLVATLWRLKRKS